MFKDSVYFSTFTSHLSQCSRVKIMHFEVGCKIREQQFVYSTSNYYQVCFWRDFIKFCTVVWQVLLLELPEETVTFSLHISEYTGVIVLFIFFFCYRRNCQLPVLLQIQSLYALTAVCDWWMSLRKGCLTFEPGSCHGWTSPGNWIQALGFSFPRSWMMSLPAVFNDSMCCKTFLVYEIKLHFTI